MTDKTLPDKTLPKTTIDEQIAELRRLSESTDAELIAELVHVINNPNHALLLNTSLLRNVWDDVSPLIDAAAEGESGLQVAGVSWDEMREAVPRLLDESLESARRIRTILSALRDGVDGSSG